MRCGSVLTIWAFSSSGATSKSGYNVFTVGTAELSECAAGQWVLMTQQELNQSVASPFRMTLSEGGQLGGAILLAWASAWCIRVMVRLVLHTDAGPSHD